MCLYFKQLTQSDGKCLFGSTEINVLRREFFFFFFGKANIAIVIASYLQYYMRSRKSRAFSLNTLSAIDLFNNRAIRMEGKKKHTWVNKRKNCYSCSKVIVYKKNRLSVQLPFSPPLPPVFFKRFKTSFLINALLNPRGSTRLTIFSPHSKPSEAFVTETRNFIWTQTINRVDMGKTFG